MVPLPERGILLVRVDYGFPDPTPAWAATWPAWDLARPGWGLSEAGPWKSADSGSAGGILRNADRLLAWERLRAGRKTLDEIARSSRSRPWILQCRFPRHARALNRALTERGVPVLLRQAGRDGTPPPVYRALAPESPLLLLHLELEWVSALACARGDAALERVGLLLARSEPLRGNTVAAALGISQGAARSYLGWMEDVALVRREGSHFTLAHPLLRRRFDPGVKVPRESHPKPSKRPDEMSVD